MEKLIGWITIFVLVVGAIANGAITVNPQALALIMRGGWNGFMNPGATAGPKPALVCDQSGNCAEQEQR